jgi:trk system potassium uptake protein TrkH
MQVSFYLLGIALQGLSMFSILPLILNMLKKSQGNIPFLTFAIVSYTTGFSLSFFFKPKIISMQYKQVFFFTSLLWITIPLFAAIPLWIELDINYTDAFFETVSAITTTGATVLAKLSIIEPEILLWRSLLQWIGGIGFIAFTIAILPFFHMKSILLFQSESTGWPMKVTSDFRDLFKNILIFYAGLTILCCCCYFIAGMTFFEAINHALTTVSTGGYSVFDNSLGYYDNYYIYWIAILFMILSSMTFITLAKCIDKKKLNILVADSQINFFVAFLMLFWLIVSIYLIFTRDYQWFDALTASAFNITSIVTTTGYVSEDYASWGNFAIAIFCLLLIVGGCSGSTAGGIKMFRIQIFFTTFLNHLKKTLQPYSVNLLTYNNKEINSNIMLSLIGFAFAFIACIFVISLLLCLDGMSLLSSFSSSASAVANVGPGLGEIVGPSSNFASLSTFSKWILSFGMLLGRLEITTLVIVCMPYLWTK